MRADVIKIWKELPVAALPAKTPPSDDELKALHVKIESKEGRHIGIADEDFRIERADCAGDDPHQNLAALRYAVNPCIFRAER
jgi:hypothetical protein